MTINQSKWSEKRLNSITEISVGAPVSQTNRENPGHWFVSDGLRAAPDPVFDISQSGCRWLSSTEVLLITASFMLCDVIPMEKQTGLDHHHRTDSDMQLCDTLLYSPYCPTPHCYGFITIFLSPFCVWLVFCWVMFSHAATLPLHGRLTNVSVLLTMLTLTMLTQEDDEGSWAQVCTPSLTNMSPFTLHSMFGTILSHSAVFSFLVWVKKLSQLVGAGKGDYLYLLVFNVKFQWTYSSERIQYF